ncbi:hypothetical protein ASG59_03435 [Methylobacterium sp. Leaf466]|nr:hypothetical protein ASG59_03435 [Methylobacterium sp. Leaf466]
MASTASPNDPLDMAEQVARVLRSNAETEKFVAEQRKLMAEQAKLAAEADKLMAERIKLATESDKLLRDRALAPVSIGFAGMAAGAAIFGAAAAFMKLLGS